MASDMPSNWKPTRFRSLLSVGVRNGLYKSKEFHGRGAKIVNMGELFGHPRLGPIPMKRVEVDESEYERFGLQSNDLIFARRSLTAEGAGKCSLVVKVDEPTVFESSIIRARPDQQKASSLFLYYLWSSPLGIHLLDTIRRQVSVAGITGKDLEEIEVPIPERAEQHAIASVLGALDDKIEQNRRTSRKLEELARGMFKAWFVDFEPVHAKAAGATSYPGMSSAAFNELPTAFNNVELGLIPQGWATATIEEVTEKVGMGPFGSAIKVSTFQASGVPVISGRHLNSYMLEDDVYNFVSVEHADRLRNSNVYRGDVVLTHAGSVGQVSYIPQTSLFERYVLSQRQFYLRPNKTRVSALFLTYFFRSDGGQHVLKANMSQTGVPSLARPVTYVRSLRILIPPTSCLSDFDSLVGCLEDQRAAIGNESRHLATLRDYLLPKLLSGQVLVKDAAKDMS